MNRFQVGPAYDTDSQFPPEFPCSAQDCDYKGWTLKELHECIACKKRFCKDCLSTIGAEKYCEACAKCACGQPALIACDECGELVCERHMAVDPLNSQCLKCRRSGPDPDDLPSEAYDPHDFQEAL